MSLSSIVKSQTSIPDNLTAAMVAGSSSAVTSSNFSIDSAALLKAYYFTMKVFKGKLINKLISSKIKKLRSSQAEINSIYRERPKELELLRRTAMM